MSSETLPYSVVQLKDGVVLVPSKWIISLLYDNTSFCYYPPIKEAAKLNEMVAKLIDPQITWKQYPVIKCLKRTGKCKYSIIILKIILINKKSY